MFHYASMLMPITFYCKGYCLNDTNISRLFSKRKATLIEPRRVVRKPDFCICENKDADQLRGNREADQRLCFRYIDTVVQSLYFLNSKFHASSHLLWLYSLVCVRPGRKPRRPIFHNEAQLNHDRSSIRQPSSLNQPLKVLYEPRCE